MQGFAFASLKFRLIFFHLLGVLIPLALTGIVSYLSIHEILTNKINDGILKSLGQVQVRLNDTLSDMAFASIQLAYEGNIGQKLSRYLSTADVSEKKRITDEIEENLTLVNYTNKSLGVMAYYVPESGKVMFQNVSIENEFDPLSNPKFHRSGDIEVFGPHSSAYRYGSHTVFSLLQRVSIPGFEEGEDVFVYLESNFNQIEKILQTEQYGMDARHMIVDREGVIIHSQDRSLFPEGGELAALDASRYLVYQSRDEGEWGVAVAIERSDYQHEFLRWGRTYGLIAFLSVAVALLFAWLLIGFIYRPTIQIYKAISAMEKENFEEPIHRTRIMEFDFLLAKFTQMRDKIVALLHEIKQKERIKGKLEVEKLLHQINPHFLYNSLNTIQWLAKLRGEEEIDRLVTVLTRVLRYNIGKEGGMVAVKDELQALYDYVELQSIRYDYQFQVGYSIDEGVLDRSIPRFILQPLVENAIYHGGDEDARIEVAIRLPDPHTVLIQVSDSGKGLDGEALNRLLHGEADDTRKSGLGVGLSFVRRIVETHYGDAGSFDVRSGAEGTRFTIRLPVLAEEEAPADAITPE